MIGCQYKKYCNNTVTQLKTLQKAHLSTSTAYLTVQEVPVWNLSGRISSGLNTRFSKSTPIQGEV